MEQDKGQCTSPNKMLGLQRLRLDTCPLMQVSTNKRYAAAAGMGFTVAECAKNVEADFGKIDILVHSLANGPEVTKPLLETSRKVQFFSLDT